MSSLPNAGIMPPAVSTTGPPVPGNPGTGIHSARSGAIQLGSVTRPMNRTVSVAMSRMR
jgi:hypothetical protein